MNLATLPTDCIACITDQLHIEYVINLWKTFNHNLQKQLENGGVRCANLWDWLPFWPPLLSKFGHHLEKIRFKVEDYGNSMHFKGFDATKLSPQLVELELAMCYSLRLLCEDAQSPVPFLDESFDGVKVVTELKDLNSMLPQLRSLKIVGSERQALDPIFLNPLTFFKLPRNLQSLILGYNDKRSLGTMPFDLASFFYFPQSLTFIEVSVTHVSQVIDQNVIGKIPLFSKNRNETLFPPLLTSLVIHEERRINDQVPVLQGSFCRPFGNSSSSLWKHFNPYETVLINDFCDKVDQSTDFLQIIQSYSYPPSLTQIQYNPSNKVELADFIHSMPKTATYIASTAYLIVDKCPVFPLQLTHLQLTIGQTTVPFIDLIKALPPCITHVNLSNSKLSYINDVQSVEIWKAMPKSVQRCSTDILNTISYEAIPYLPIGLSEIALRPPRQDEKLSGFPEGMKVKTLHSNHFSKTFSHDPLPGALDQLETWNDYSDAIVSSVEFLPPTLTGLRLSRITPDSPEFPIHQLPSQLVFLSLGGIAYTNWLRFLPITLERLVLNTLRHVNCDNIQTPPHMKQFMFAFHPDPSDLTSDDNETNFQQDVEGTMATSRKFQPWWVSLTESLPESLESYKIYIKDKLPNKMQTLPSYTLSIARLLPRSLQILTINLDGSTDEWLSLLPPRLIHLNIGASVCTFTPNFRLHLPRKLQSLVLPASCASCCSFKENAPEWDDFPTPLAHIRPSFDDGVPTPRINLALNFQNHCIRKFAFDRSL